MQEVQGLDTKGFLETLPNGVKLYTLFNNRVPWAFFADEDMKALGLEMTKIASSGVSALAGYTYLGQFLAHDLSRVRVAGHSQTVKSFQTDVLSSKVTAVLDLGSVYDGADAGSSLRHGSSPRMALGSAQMADGSLLCGYDLPRDGFSACIGDDRNDENLIVSQLHVQFLRLHNFFVDRIQAEQPHLDNEALFQAARDQVVLHYQEVILYDFLYEILHPSVWKAIILDDRSIVWDPELDKEAVLPIEYSAAAGRFGHSMVRAEYDLNMRTHVEMDDLFTMTGAGRFGGKYHRLPATHLIDWLLFFKFPTVKRSPFSKINKSLAISPRVSVALKHTELLSDPDEKNLASRNLMRGYQMRLGSGQAAVRYLRTCFHKELDECDIPIRLLTQDELNPGRSGSEPGVLEKCNPDLCENTPLWFYLLAEARVKPVDGIFKLGPLGSLIMAESVKGLLKINNSSFGVQKQQKL